MATDDSYRDLTNLERKLQKHEAFEAELKANEARLHDIDSVRVHPCPSCRVLQPHFSVEPHIYDGLELGDHTWGDLEKVYLLPSSVLVEDCSTSGEVTDLYSPISNIVNRNSHMEVLYSGVSLYNVNIFLVGFL